mgnify:CR=1 FL=1
MSNVTLQAKPGRPSLLSQISRYGDLEEPEHVDDFAYVTPEMLEGLFLNLFLIYFDRFQDVAEHGCIAEHYVALSLLVEILILFFTDEHETALSKRNLNKQQSVIADNLKHSHELRMLLSKPGTAVCVTSSLKYPSISTYTFAYVSMFLCRCSTVRVTCCRQPCSLSPFPSLPLSISLSFHPSHMHMYILLLYPPALPLINIIHKYL